MYLGARLWLTVSGWLHLSPSTDFGAEQIPIGGKAEVFELNPAGRHGPIPPPRFTPPGVGGDKFKCEYPQMEGFSFCSTPENRECWLRNSTGYEYNIHSNYEKIYPIGKVRNYTLIVSDGSINADGQDFSDAKLFNGSFPGPWLEACWGDFVNIKVINNMKNNGTSIHWHGIRQYLSMQMDGVNGITQCPIAARNFSSTKNTQYGGNFTYSWRATQYGTSWYHSHYSAQYADGLQGPLTVHGPTSAPFDESKEPILMTDWAHVSAFEVLAAGAVGYRVQTNTTILFNGKGSVNKFGYEPANPQEIPATYELHFKVRDITTPGRPRRYLLRLINTSFDSTFVFSIDNHWLQMVTADFVPIEPYYNTSVLIGIGQRYNVIVEANPMAGYTNPVPADGNFWIRTWVADNCGTAGGRMGYEKTGILRYNPLMTSEPTSQPWSNIELRCSDENASSLKPKVPWYVGNASNSKPQIPDHEQGQRFGVQLNRTGGTDVFPLAKFSFEPGAGKGFVPLQIDYGNPSIMSLSNFSTPWPKPWVVVPEDYGDDDWVYLALTGAQEGTIGAHPIHLHGHDFAILQQAENTPFTPENVKLNRVNPPRRDVVLLPRDGFVVIAFKTDNPGLWLMHCHIARHASEGLAIQINERQRDADKLWPKNGPTVTEASRVCKDWVDWKAECRNHWPGKNSTGQYPACDREKEPEKKFWPFQDDSGI